MNTFKKRELPLTTLIVSSLSVVVWCFPAFRSVLAYDRHAILQGELWRVITGHWVHFSSEHFLFDTAAFALAGWMIEVRQYRKFGWLCVVSVFMMSGAMLVCEPRLEICGGLSGMATGAVVFLALNGLSEKNSWKFACLLALLLTSAKLLAELISGRFVFLQTSSAFVPVPSNHLAGVFTATLFYAWLRWRKWTVANFRAIRFCPARECVKYCHARAGHQPCTDARVGKRHLGVRPD